MARTLDNIKTLITNKYVSEMAAIGETVDPTTWSAVSLERLVIYVFAFCQFVLEQIFDTHKADVESIIANKTPHRINWYANKVLDFMFGYDLIADQDIYDTTGLSESDIATAKVVAHCTVTDRADILTIKVAKNNGSDLEPLSNTELAALQSYMHKIKDAGVFLTFVNEAADSLLANISIQYNAMILDENGVDILSGIETVKNAVKDYLKSLPFNGEFSLQALVDVLQKVDGVVYANLKSIRVKATISSIYQDVTTYYIPASGYLRIINNSDLVLNYTPYAH